MALKEIIQNIGAFVSVNEADTAITQGFIVAERSNQFVVAVAKLLDEDLHTQINYDTNFSIEKIQMCLQKGWSLDEIVSVTLNEHLFEYKHFYKTSHSFEVIHSPTVKPKIYSPIKKFNPEFNLVVEFFGCSEAALPEMERIIITSIGSENFYYLWNGMPFVSKQYMIANRNDLKIGVSSVVSKDGGMHVIQAEKDGIVNIDKWFEQHLNKAVVAA